MAVSVAAVYVLVAEDIPSGLVEVPEQGRGDLLDKGGYRGLAGLGDGPSVARWHALCEHPAIGSVDDGGQRRVLPCGGYAHAGDAAGAGLDRLLQRTGQIIPRDALFHGAPHVMGGPAGCRVPRWPGPARVLSLSTAGRCSRCTSTS